MGAESDEARNVEGMERFGQPLHALPGAWLDKRTVQLAAESPRRSGQLWRLNSSFFSVAKKLSATALS